MFEFVPIQKRTVSDQPLGTGLPRYYWSASLLSGKLNVHRTPPSLTLNLPPQLLGSSEPTVFSSIEPATATTAMGPSPEEGPVWSCGQLLEGSCLVYPMV